MGRYLNPGMESFEKSVNSEIYVDKTGLVGYTNRVMNTVQGYVCVSRPRRFGKSMAANMLTAYYSRGCDSREIFSKFESLKSTLLCKANFSLILLSISSFAGLAIAIVLVAYLDNVISEISIILNSTLKSFSLY